jgi:hypothetical protein
MPVSVSTAAIDVYCISVFLNAPPPPPEQSKTFPRPTTVPAARFQVGLYSESCRCQDCLCFGLYFGLQ